MQLQYRHVTGRLGNQRSQLHLKVVMRQSSFRWYKDSLHLLSSSRSLLPSLSLFNCFRWRYLISTAAQLS